MIKRPSTDDVQTQRDDKKRRRSNLFSSLPVTPINKYARDFPFFRQPVEFGFFSLDGERQFQDDDSMLRYFKHPGETYDLEFDLTKGYENRVEKDDDVKERLTHLLTWIKKHRRRFQLSNQAPVKDDKKLNTDFVAWRGHLTKFLCTPYETREPWKMAATLYNGTIYISEVETEKAKFDRQHRSSRQNEMCYWGYKFEDYLTEPRQASQEKSPLQPSVVNTNEAYCTIVRTRLKNHSILMGAEVDCCTRDAAKRPPNNYIELKTTRIMQHFKQRQNFARYKLIKFWGQSFLAGLPEIVVGLRDDDGIVRELKTYKTIEIPAVCKGFPNHWNPNICMNFLDGLLSWLKQIVTIDNKDVVYMMNFEPPFDKVRLDLIDDGTECFLPDWYVVSSES